MSKFSRVVVVALGAGALLSSHSWAVAQPPPDAGQQERALGALYNQVAKTRGPRAAMEAVYTRAREVLPTMRASEAPAFGRALEKWALEMQERNPALLAEYQKFHKTFGDGRPWLWTTPFAEKQIRSFQWAKQNPRGVRCRGVANANAVFRSGVGRYSDFRCEFELSDGWSNFRIHAGSDVNFTTSDWRDGHIGASTAGGGGGGGGCATASGVTFQLHSVTCTAAVNVWFELTHRGAPPSGWLCTVGNRCEGPPDFTGLAGWFSWR